MKTVKEIIYEMLTENTGIAMCDSGGENGRMWQRNQGKTIADFEAEPVVSFDKITTEKDSTEICFVVSLWHYLTRVLDRDELCELFDAKNKSAGNWDFYGAYGVSAEAGSFLEDTMNAKLDKAWNTYNGEDYLSQILQGCGVELCGRKYVILQIHGGADVRGGYTDARLFLFADQDAPYIDPCPCVDGDIDGTSVTAGYNGVSLTDEGGSPVPVTPESEITLHANFDY